MLRETDALLLQSLFLIGKRVRQELDPSVDATGCRTTLRLFERSHGRHERGEPAEALGQRAGRGAVGDLSSSYQLICRFRIPEEKFRIGDPDRRPFPHCVYHSRTPSIPPPPNLRTLSLQLFASGLRDVGRPYAHAFSPPGVRAIVPTVCVCMHHCTAPLPIALAKHAPEHGPWAKSGGCAAAAAALIVALLLLCSC